MRAAERIAYLSSGLFSAFPAEDACVYERASDIAFSAGFGPELELGIGFFIPCVFCGFFSHGNCMLEESVSLIKYVFLFNYMSNNFFAVL